MTMSDEGLSHTQTWDLIPWVVNGTATAEQRARVEQHLRDCADCRREFALQQQFQAGLREDAETEPDPRPGLERLFARIDADADAVPPAEAIMHRSGGWLRWLAAAVVVQAVGLALLAGMLLGRGAAPDDYRTLSAAPVRSEAVIRLVVAPDTTLAALGELLADTRLRIVESTADNGAFGLAPRDATTSPDVAATVAELRRRPGVLLAEPIAGAAGKVP
jgi:predicted anti-sigma-YlaC factor YlaD